MPFDRRRIGLEGDLDGGIGVVPPPLDDVEDAVNPPREALSLPAVDECLQLGRQIFVAFEVVIMFVDPVANDVEDPQLHRLDVLFAKAFRRSAGGGGVVAIGVDDDGVAAFSPPLLPKTQPGRNLRRTPTMAATKGGSRRTPTTATTGADRRRKT